MSAFASKNFQSHDYALHRPSYSIDFFKYIFKFGNLSEVIKDELSIVDIGCGPATCELVFIPYLIELIESKQLNLNKIKIYVTDISSTMINEAESTLNNLLLNKLSKSIKNIFEIKFLVISGENLNNIINESSVDLVIAAECVHWINPNPWLNSMKSILKSNTGVLAYWGYVDPVFIGHEGEKENINKANDFYNDFVYEEEGKLGVYWQQPGRKILRGLCKDINNIVFQDTESWNDVITVYRDPSKNDIKILDRLINNDINFKIDDEVLKMIKSITFEQFLQYTDTWSSSHKWNENHNEDEKVSKLFYKGLNKITNWKLSDNIEIEMKTFYTLCKKS
ncbi:hypothetical protein C6P40_002350 [Pichia californica]|uniref:Methyltransferase type 11 domain-containing protein n=1 Tax=Pichia californica TaxID=460514 RepID=A0A9P6WJV2_9ASCO|nr:hypothetical protein C6P42_004962 [[Candida] californica]KAG0687442.1 hypothetical protein C6P40_002350 [[Candida] californica]